LWLRTLSGRNFRNLVDDRFPLETGISWLFGPNGQGKTNFLEMAYFALTSKSFRTSRNAELARETRLPVSVSAEVVKGSGSLRFGVALEKGTTTRYLGGKVCKTMAFFESAAGIAFTARSKNLVEGSPDDRRRFIDRMVAYLDPNHMVTMSRYRRSMSQLKKELLGGKNLGVYRGFKAALLPTALEIAKRRRQFLEGVRERAGELFADVFAGEGELQVEYVQRGLDTPDQLEKRMMDQCAREVLTGRTLVGPHLDDLDIFIRDQRAKRRASSGQVRAVVLSLKIAVRESYKNRRGYHPILLLDDIDAELDPQRLGKLLTYLSGRGQTLISTSKYGMIDRSVESRVFEVNAGRISPLEER